MGCRPRDTRADLWGTPTTWVGTTEVRALRIEMGDDGEEYLYLGPPVAVDMNGTMRRVEVKTVRAGTDVKTAPKLS